MKLTLLIKAVFRRLVLLMPIALFWFVSGFAQHTVTGTVYDANTNEPLPGATIAVEGTKIGTTTNMVSSYELTVKAGGRFSVWSSRG